MSRTATATKFVARESYMHEYAKEVLKEWLESGPMGELGYPGSSIYHIEYPIVKTENDDGNHTSWDNDIFEWYMGEDWPYGNPVQMS